MNASETLPLLLVIDDELLIHRAFERVFRRSGFRIAGAQDGDTGLDAARAEPPDVILLDVNMPRLDGRDVLSRLNADPALSHIPVIVITGRTDHLTRLAMLDAGAEDVVEKPFDTARLGRKISWLLAKAVNPVLPPSETATEAPRG